jgi:hypothetical protein
MNRVVPKAKTIDGPRPKVLNHNVHVVEQLQAKINSLRVFEVNRDAAFSSVQAEKERSLAARERRTPPATKFASSGWLEFVDFGSVVGEEQSAVRSGERMGKIQYP